MRDSSKGGELDLADGVRRRCKKNSSPVSFCIDKRTKEAVTVAAKSKQFTLHSRRGGEGPVSLEAFAESAPVHLKCMC